MKIISLMSAIFLIVVSGYAQVNEKSERKFYKQGDWEIGITTNIGSSSVQTMGPHSWNDSLKYHDFSEDTKKWIYVHLGISTGYYIINGLSIEPEVSLNSYAEGFSVSILGNLNYTFDLPQKNIYPYVKLGYGLSNDPENKDGLFESLYYKTINAGVGLKFMYFPHMAFKVEINYRNLNGSNTFFPNTPDPYKTETTTSIISVSIGVSI